MAVLVGRRSTYLFLAIKKGFSTPDAWAPGWEDWISPAFPLPMIQKGKYIVESEPGIGSKEGLELGQSFGRGLMMMS
jgi:hypothetical protein